MSEVGRARDRDPHPRGIAFGFDRAGITPVRFPEPTPVKYATLFFGIERGTAGQALIDADYKTGVRLGLLGKVNFKEEMLKNVGIS